MGYITPIVLLVISNVFMTFAWYGHLKYTERALWITILLSWGIAFFEYCFMIPANRMGYLAGMSAGQLKVIQEAITLTVFLVFASLYLGEKLTWNYYVGFLMVLSGVAVMFWGR
jgi:uncharacterized protein (DUF486 family)